MYVGIDWAADEHAVCIIEADGRVADRFSIAHSAEGFEQLVSRLARRAEPAALPVALERPDGRLVDRLLEAGHPVVPVKTTAIKAWREAEVGSGAKSDPGDARVIADYLRLRGPGLRPLRPFSDETRALRAVVRSRSDLVELRVAAANQLRAVLAAAWPGAGELFADVSSPISLAFLERYPTATSAARLGEGRMGAFLRKHGYSGRRRPAELLERLRAAPAGLADGPESGARRDVVLAMVRVLRALDRSIKDLDRSVVARLGEHPDAGSLVSVGNTPISVFIGHPDSLDSEAQMLPIAAGDEVIITEETYKRYDNVSIGHWYRVARHTNSTNATVQFRVRVRLYDTGITPVPVALKTAIKDQIVVKVAKHRT